jgi:hypothetical protein
MQNVTSPVPVSVYGYRYTIPSATAPSGPAPFLNVAPVIIQRLRVQGISSPSGLQFALLPALPSALVFDNRSGNTPSAFHTAEKLASDFYKATLDHTPGINVDEVKRIFAIVHQQNTHKAFDEAIVHKARQEGYLIKGAVHILDKKFSGLLKPFMQVPRKECMDILLHGKNRYRSTPAEYRLRGMWTAIADFLTVCKKHPILSTSIIGSVAYLGGTYPFLGAVSGIAIMAWASAVTVFSELKAKHLPVMNAEKAGHYVRSGENIAAFLLTFSGVDGIYKGAKNGVDIMAKSTALQHNTNGMAQYGVKTWHAISAKLKHGEEVGIRFVIGLFDNVLLPFNGLADRMNR